jgi:decaprenylphospho-beta-D-ribofuranose 2-oxidase
MMLPRVGINVQRADWPSNNVRLVSFDGGFAGHVKCVQPDRYRFWDAKHNTVGISRGAGLSYAAASFATSGTSVDHRHFNRILDFDSSSSTLEVEAGATLASIYDFATSRGLFLSVQPGHPCITVGGCIGTDVHGKNQYRDGTMMSQVVSLRLFHPRYGILELSRNQEAKLFQLTCGGYGLTGNIVTARLKLTPLPSMLVRLEASRIRSCTELPAALSNVALESDLVYSWHDFNARGSNFGGGLLISGKFLTGNAALEQTCQPSLSACNLTAQDRGAYRLPLLNRVTVPLLNQAYKRIATKSAGKCVPLHKFLFPVLGKEMYFRFFGTPGFHEYQVLLPSPSFPMFVDEVKRRLSRRPLAITLASGKLFSGRRDLLRFTGDGVCFALNFARSAAGMQFASFLDGLTCELSGWPNIAKDSRLPVSVVRSSYAEYDRFRSLLHSFDPQRLYQSELSQRLEL